jgi:dTDP-glucose 4,6-dehydratase
MMPNLRPLPSSSQSESTWIITGGAGFIGSNLVRSLLRHRPDLNIVVLDKLTYAGSLENLRDLPGESRFEFLRGDIAKQKDVDEAFKTYRPQCVLNLAAESHVDRSIDSPARFIETNIRGTFELLESSRRLYAELSPAEQDSFRFLQVSTDEVFGSLGPEGSFDEETPYAPNSPYSASKASADMLVRAYYKTYGLPTLTTNCSNNYGPYQLPEKLIPLMILNALEGKALPVYGDGANVRDWIYVDDHCSGIIRAVESGEPGERYAFGGNSERSNLEVIHSICDVLESIRPASTNPALLSLGVAAYRDLITFVEDRPGHDLRYAIDSSKVARELNWIPSYTFEEALAKTVRWYVDHEDWRAAIEAQSGVRTRQGLSDGSEETTASAPSGGRE